jgi:2-methylcitrate dehydratase PrpD
MKPGITTASGALAEWTLGLQQSDLPSDIVEAVQLRLLDTIGIMLAATDTPIGRAARDGALAMASGTSSRIVGFGDRSSAMLTALADGTLAHAMDFDDTHDPSLVHPSAAIVPAALAVGEMVGASGKELLVVLAAGSEICCRLGNVAPMAFHKRGLHPTGLLTGFGATTVAGRLLGLEPSKMQAAIGIHGSQAAGLLESFSDGTWVKTMHPGWAAFSGIAAVHLAANGFTGPATVFEGRRGLFAALAGAPEGGLHFSRLTSELGHTWEFRRSSVKFYPCAQVIQPFVDLALAAYRQGLRHDHIRTITAPVAEQYIGVVAKPRAEKLCPFTPTHARASLQYCIATAILLGHCGPAAFTEEIIHNAAVLSLAGRVATPVEISPTAPGQLRARIMIETNEGRRWESVLEHHRGSVENPLARADVEAKFEANTGHILSREQRRALRGTTEDLAALPSVARLLDNCIRGRLD